VSVVIWGSNFWFLNLILGFQSWIKMDCVLSNPFRGQWRIRGAQSASIDLCFSRSNCTINLITMCTNLSQFD
jgi:hypothetical protein